MKKLKERQIFNKLESLREYSLICRDIPSWVRYLREALGMSAEQLSKRLGVSKVNVYRVEKAEKSGAVTLKSLREMADKMHCDLAYAFVPRAPISEIKEDRAHTLAMGLFKETLVNMELEDQALESDAELKAQFEDLKEEIKSSKRLWD